MQILSKSIFLFFSAIALVGCGTPELIVEEAEYFEQQVKGHPSIILAPEKKTPFDLNYASSGNPKKPALLFIHGTPGGWDNFSRYLMDKQLQNRAHLVAIDRPGWGGLELGENQVEPSFSRQAERIKPLLEQLRQTNNGAGVILIGHSLGASLAPRIAMDYPELVDGLLLIAGSLDPNLGKPRWYNRVASMGAVSWFLRDSLRKANEEIMPLRKQLSLMQPHWADIRMPITLIQGMKDKLVHPQNADFAEQVLINADLKVVRLEQAGHFTIWQNRDSVNAALEELMDKIQKREQP